MGHALTQCEVIVRLPEETDIGNAAGIAEELTSAVSRNAVVIIDMSATRFCDCAGVRGIARAHKRATGGGAQLRLVVTAASVRGYSAPSGPIACLTFIPAWRQRTARCPDRLVLCST